ncbi:hypothetical protein DUI87_03109 [Hirundo rustica rustica]|uniref:Retropepsins domain-containing protein n=1 Tax=Hirundo rustica rustica TaxID=333673 RepID=A0A3M0L3F3_HIRRU|nr:hypothetical protein DUI87_03109 [Hirundo rustica rustica]
MPHFGVNFLLILTEDPKMPGNPDLVPCTSMMWQKLVRLGPQEYASALAMKKWGDGDGTVLDMAKKLQAYADAVHGPTYARISAVETCLSERRQKIDDKMEDNHKRLRKEIKGDLLQISAVQTRGSPEKTVWIRWPGTSEPQKYEALVDTGAQCTLIPLRHVGAESVSIAGVTGESQDLTLVEAEESLTGNEQKKHPIVTGPEAPCILGIDFLQSSLLRHHYRALNEVTQPLSTAAPDMMELQYELKSKASKWYATTDIANAFFSIPLSAECRPQIAFTWRGMQYTCVMVLI